MPTNNIPITPEDRLHGSQLQAWTVRSYELIKISFVLKVTVNTDQSELMFQLCYKNEIFLWKKKKQRIDQELTIPDYITKN